MDKLVAAIILAHSWYGWECCSDKDCHPYEGTVIEGPDAYTLKDGTKIPYTDPRVKQGKDEDFHICVNPSGAILCLYRPNRGA